MEKIVVKLLIGQEQAIIGGFYQFGEVETNLDLAQLSDAQRKELLTCKWGYSNVYLVSNRVDVGKHSADYILERDVIETLKYYPSNTSFNEVIKVLDCRIAIRALTESAIADQQKQEEIDKQLLREADLEIGKNPMNYVVTVNEYKNDLSEEIKALNNEYSFDMRKECMPNLTKLEKDVEEYNNVKSIEKKEKEKAYKREQYETLLGCYNPDKLERYRANCLPEEELDGAVLDVIFDTFEESKVLTYYIKLQGEDILSDEDNCNHADCVSYKVKHVGNVDIDNMVINNIYSPIELTGKSFDAVKYLVDACKDMRENNLQICEEIGIRIMRHTATCDYCDNYTEKYGAKVDVRWNGETYSREYDIFDEPK